MKIICKVLKPFTENGAFYPIDSEIVIERKRALQLGDLVEVQREVEEKVRIVRKSKKSSRRSGISSPDGHRGTQKS